MEVNKERGESKQEIFRERNIYRDKKKSIRKNKEGKNGQLMGSKAEVRSRCKEYFDYILKFKDDKATYRS